MPRIKLAEPCVVFTAFAVFLAAGSSAAAQEIGDVSSTSARSENDVSDDDAIVVTARRREERLIDVPVAITALPSERLERYSATDLTEIGALAGNVVILPSGNGTGASISIRGVGSTATDAGVEQTVTVNIDGVPIGRGRIIAMTMFDLEAVEVLKGPQSLFFGKNSPGGVISITTRGPSDDFEGFARGGYEFKARRRFFEGALSVPLSSTAATRLAFRATKSKGFIKNAAEPLLTPFQPGILLPGAPAEKGTYEDVLGRLTATLEPSDRFNATLKATIGRSLEENSVPSETKCAAEIKPFVTTIGFPDPFSDCELNLRTTLTNISDRSASGYPEHGRVFSEVKTELVGLTMNYSLGAIDLTSVTSYYHFTSENFAPLSGSSVEFFAGINNEYNTSFTQEIRANSSFEGPLNFTAGFFYENSDRRFFSVTELGPLPPDALGNTFTAQVDFELDTKSYSFFGQVRAEILPEVEIAGGARWIREEKSGFLGNTVVHPFALFPLLPAGQYINHDFSDEQVTPEVTLSWKPSSNLMIYGAYKTGYKAPGFTNSVVITQAYNQDNTSFAAEHAKGGEVGVKFQALENKLTGSVTAFFYKFDDLQVISFDAATINYIVRNAARSRTQGIEFQLDWRATNRLRFAGIGSYIDAKYLDFPNAQCYVGQNVVGTGCNASGNQDLSNRRLPTTPKFSGRLGVSYDLPLSDKLAATWTMDANYSSSYFGGASLSPFAIQKSYATVDSSVRFFQEDTGSWEFAVIAKNLFDKRYFQSGNDTPGGGIGDLSYIVGDPRTVLLQGTIRF